MPERDVRAARSRARLPAALLPERLARGEPGSVSLLSGATQALQRLAVGPAVPMALRRFQAAAWVKYSWAPRCESIFLPALDSGLPRAAAARGRRRWGGIESPIPQAAQAGVFRPHPEICQLRVLESYLRRHPVNHRVSEQQVPPEPTGNR